MSDSKNIEYKQKPDIKEKDGGFMVVLYKAAKDTDEGVVMGGQVGGQAGGQVGGQDAGIIDTLTDRQKEVFKMIVANPKISRKQLAEKLGINESAVQKHTDALKKKGVIERESETTGQWTIKVFK